MHGRAKEQSEIDSEKELIETATVQAMGKNKYGNVTKNGLEEKLNANAGDGTTKIIDNGDTLVVKFIESNRYYEVDNDGNVEIFEVIEDKNPGDITKDKEGNNLDGTEENPYEIWCIEDLIEWSKNYSEYKNSYIVLGRTLNFKSSLSYSNSESTEYGDINEDGKIQRIIEEMQTGIGFTPIANFNSNFDGQGFEIKNIYINSQIDNVALISQVGIEAICIKNLGITGTITGTKNVGGILGNAGKPNDFKILNCYNKANIYNYNTYTGVSLNGVGGILGYIANGKLTIQECYNTGNIYSASELNTYGYSGVGGILGKTHSNTGTIVVNSCYNAGKIEGNGCRAGGITGVGDLILNSYNSGKIINGSGITGFGREVVNCFNIGETTNGIYGSAYNIAITIKNVYTIAKTSAFPIVNWSNSACTYDILNAFYSENCSQSDNRGTKISEVLMKSNGSNDTDDEKSLLTLLNNFVDEYNSSENTIELNHWKINSENGYPTFE